MIKMKVFINKTWVFIAAAVIIIGSCSAMAFALNNSIPESGASDTGPIMAETGKNVQQQVSSANTPAYTVVDLSKAEPDPERKNALYTKLNQSDMTAEQIDARYRAYLANSIPGEKDMTADQAAAYAADIIKKAYEIDLTGYTAEASFSRNPVPNSDNWTVIFHQAQEEESSIRYLAAVDSVSGIMLNACFYSFDYREEISTNLDDPAWLDTAVSDIKKLIPENVTVTGSNVVGATREIGVMVVCELSDGSAVAVRLSGESMAAAAYQFFPTGYDGSWDYHAPTEQGVG